MKCHRTISLLILYLKQFLCVYVAEIHLMNCVTYLWVWHSYYDHQCNFQWISGPSYIDIHNFESEKQYQAAKNEKKYNIKDIRYYSY